MENQKPPIFIGGEGRSGTTLMRVILDSHPNIACGPETHFFLDERLQPLSQSMAEMNREWLLEYSSSPEEIMDICFGGILDTFHRKYAEKKGKTRWADKTPYNIKIIDFLFRAFPNMKFIHMIRDGRDSASSHLEMPWAPKEIDVLAKSWVECIGHGKKYREHPDHYLEIKYEDLVNDFRTTLDSVLHFIDEPWSDGLYKYNELDHDLGYESSSEAVQKKLYKSSIGRWKTELSKEQLDIYHAIAGDTLEELGYPTKKSPL